MEPPAHQTKRELCEKLLAQGMVMVVVDARQEGVRVPPHLSGDATLRLNLSWRFGSPMAIEEWGVRATLSFSGVPFDCALPWPAIYVLFAHKSGDPYVFPEDVPADSLAGRAGSEALAPDADADNAAKGPVLRLVQAPEANAPEPEAEPETLAEPPPPAPTSGRRRGHLRVIK